MLDTLARRRSSVLRARAPDHTRLPHPSWRRTLEAPPGDGAASIRDAGDFWSRLGL